MINHNKHLSYSNLATEVAQHAFRALERFQPPTQIIYDSLTTPPKTPFLA